MDGRVIMGIDPGTNTTGYGVIRTEGNALSCIVLGDIDLHRIGDPYQTSSRTPTPNCAISSSGSGR